MYVVITPDKIYGPMMHQDALKMNYYGNYEVEEAENYSESVLTDPKDFVWDQITDVCEDKEEPPVEIAYAETIEYAAEDIEKVLEEKFDVDNDIYGANKIYCSVQIIKKYAEMLRKSTRLKK